MGDSWVTVIFLGLAASFMPLVFGIEIYSLGDDDGVKKVSGLLGGIVSFRLLVTVGVILLFVGVLASLSEGLANIGHFLGSLLLRFGEGVTSGHHLVIDLLLIAAGVLIIVQAFRHLRAGSNAGHAPTSSSDSKSLSVGAVGMIGVGLMMTATNVNQWVFTTAAVNELIRMEAHPWSRLLAFFLFLALSTLMVVAPLALVLARPQNATAELQKVNGWINGSMRYVATGILTLIGLYLIVKGGIGVANFLSGSISL